jgi:flagellar FliJ protein
MAFRFSLAAVLRLREIHEEREERLLTQALAQVTEAREALAALGEALAAAIQNREVALSLSMGVAELHAAYGLERLLRERRAAASVRLGETERQRDAQILCYQKAHREREVLATMETRQKESYRVTRARREQTAIDDIFMARRSRK